MGGLTSLGNPDVYLESPQSRSRSPRVRHELFLTKSTLTPIQVEQYLGSSTLRRKQLQQAVPLRGVLVNDWGGLEPSLILSSLGSTPSLPRFQCPRYLSPPAQGALHSVQTWFSTLHRHGPPRVFQGSMCSHGAPGWLSR